MKKLVISLLIAALCLSAAACKPSESEEELPMGSGTVQQPADNTADPSVPQPEEGATQTPGTAQTPETPAPTQPSGGTTATQPAAKPQTTPSGNASATKNPASEFAALLKDGKVDAAYALAQKETALQDKLQHFHWVCTSADYVGPVNESIAYTYDAKGNCVSYRVDDYIDVNISYDAKGRITKTVRKCPGDSTQEITFTYSGDQIDCSSATVKYDGSSETYTYGYDSKGRLSSKSTKSGVTTTFTYGQYDAPDKIIQKRGSTTNTITYTYRKIGDRLALLDESIVSDNENAPESITDYLVDGKGQPIKCTEYGDRFRSEVLNEREYKYDQNGRLESETCKGEEESSTFYTYDANGNLTQKLMQTRRDSSSYLTETYTYGGWKMVYNENYTKVKAYFNQRMVHVASKYRTALFSGNAYNLILNLE